jgi:hypothetical protein
MVIGLAAGAVLLTGCTSVDRAAEGTSAAPVASPVNSPVASPVRSPEPSAPEPSAPESESAQTPVPEPWSDVADEVAEADQSTGGSVRGMPSQQPFGVVNNLPVAVKIDVSDVDPYDWSSSEVAGRPDYKIPAGFTGVIKSGTSTVGVFFPNYLASNAPFRLNVSAWTPANADAPTASQPIGSVSFDRIYFCLLQIIQSDCSILTSKEWYGWGYRVDNPKAVRNQVPQMCGRTSELGTYVFNNVTRKARVRLECASTKALAIGNAAILEDVPQ